MAERPLIVETVDWDLPLGVIGEPTLVWDIVGLDNCVIDKIGH